MKHIIFISGLLLLATFIYLPSTEQKVEVQCLEQGHLESINQRLDSVMIYMNDHRKPEQ